MAAPTIDAPVPGATLDGAEQTFVWSANGTGADQWWLYVGDEPGGRRFANTRNLGNVTSIALGGLPTDGSTVHVRLWYRTGDGGTWQSIDESYTAATLAGTTPTIDAPVPGATLDGAEQTFTWSANASGADRWWLHVGSAAGGKDLHDSGALGTATSAAVGGLPTDGSTVYVRLWYRTGDSGAWGRIDQSFTAAESD